LNLNRLAANALTGSRVIAGLAVAMRPSLAVLVAAIATDWIDGTLARRGGDASYGARFDLEADSLLTLGTAVAAVRRGASPMVLIAPIARYAMIAVRDPRSFAAPEIRTDRVTGIAQMTLLAGWIAHGPAPLLSALAVPVTAARCAALAALAGTAGVHSTSTQRPAEARLVQTPGAGAPDGAGAPVGGPR
jgi:phosphatidylglycerophosphate synthase